MRVLVGAGIRGKHGPDTVSQEVEFCRARPADGGARLLQVSSHHDDEVVLEFVGQSLETAAVLQSHSGAERNVLTQASLSDLSDQELECPGTILGERRF